MNKTRESRVPLNNRITVTQSELPELLGCGKQMADEIAADAKAKVYRGKRVLINVDKIKKYIDSESFE